ncbi:hypothetical protein DAMA08_011530 [Martiniozyma asiatica (nom. inval.)]|nr:hypothetical protein DAMA08_011530 [Martiniozyma asiatica]
MKENILGRLGVRFSSYLSNANLLREKYNFHEVDFSSYVNHITRLDIPLRRDPSFGSLVTVNTIETGKIETGLVINEPLNFLSANRSYRVLLPDQSIKDVPLSKINLTIPNVINKQQFTDFDETHKVALSKLSYTLNTILLHSEKVEEEIIRQDLPRETFLHFASINSCKSFDLNSLSLKMLETSPSLNKMLNIKNLPISTYSILLASHYITMRDPIRFRIEKSCKESIFKYLTPLEMKTSESFLNPLNLVENLLVSYLHPTKNLVEKYKDLLNENGGFILYRKLRDDHLLKSIILLIRYTLVNPHYLLFKKLQPLFNEPLNYKVLKKFLIDKRLYDENDNEILSSGIYGFPKHNLTESLFTMNDINDLPLTDNIYSIIKSKKLDKWKKIKNLTFGNKIENQSFTEIPDWDDRKMTKLTNKDTNEKIKILNDSDKLNTIINTAKNELKGDLKIKHPIIYRINNRLAFSVEHLSLTEYKFNFYIPIPKYNIKESQIEKSPIDITQFINSTLNSNEEPFKSISFPHSESFRLDKIKNSIKISFIHNLIDANTLNNPKITVSLDNPTKMTKVSQSWFNNEPPQNEKSLKCWISMGKLLNLLKEKEKARIRNGFLKIGRQILSSNIDNNSIYSNSNNRIWLLKSIQLLIDESLSNYCKENKIPISFRTILKNEGASEDQRIFHKLKIFKWYANSYDTFNFQFLSSGGDIMALIGCLPFLGKNEWRFNDNSITEKTNFTPLGLKMFASFSDFRFFETYLNLNQLFRHLLNIYQIKTVKPYVDFLHEIEIKIDDSKSRLLVPDFKNNLSLTATKKFQLNKKFSFKLNENNLNSLKFNDYNIKLDNIDDYSYRHILELSCKTLNDNSIVELNRQKLIADIKQRVRFYIWRELWINENSNIWKLSDSLFDFDLTNNVKCFIEKLKMKNVETSALYELSKAVNNGLVILTEDSISINPSVELNKDYQFALLQLLKITNPIELQSLITQSDKLEAFLLDVPIFAALVENNKIENDFHWKQILLSFIKDELNSIGNTINSKILNLTLLSYASQVSKSIHKYNVYVSNAPSISKRTFYEVRSCADGVLDLQQRLERYDKLRKVEKDLSLKEIQMFKCLLLKESEENGLFESYCLDLDMFVLVQLDKELPWKVGDKLLCSQVVDVEPAIDRLVLK